MGEGHQIPTDEEDHKARSTKRMKGMEEVHGDNIFLNSQSNVHINQEPIFYKQMVTRETSKRTECVEDKPNNEYGDLKIEEHHFIDYE